MENTKKFKTASEHIPNAKRKKILAAIAQEIVTSEDDDNIVDAMNICDIIECHNDKHKQPTSSKAIYALGETIRNTLLEINEIREQNRERRHNELKEILTKIAFNDNVTSKCDASMNGKINDASLISNQRKIKQSVGEDQQTISEQYKIDEIKTEAIVDEELCNSNSNSTLTNVNTVVDSKDFKMHKFTETAISPLTSIIKPLKNVNSVVVVKKSQSDLDEMRDQMLEMQRKKMEDRVRKKRKFLHIKNEY